MPAFLKFGIPEVAVAAGDLLVIISMFLPWIFGFPPQAGTTPVTQVIAAPNMLQLAFQSRFWYLSIVPVGVVLGAVEAIIGASVGRRTRLLMIAATFLMLWIPIFGFNGDYAIATSLFLNGKLVAFTTTKGTGWAIAILGTFISGGGLLIAWFIE